MMIRLIFAIIVLLLPFGQAQAQLHGTSPPVDLPTTIIPAGASPSVSARTYGPITLPASINVNFANGPGDGTDFIIFRNYFTHEVYDAGEVYIPAGMTSGTVSMVIPDVNSDRYALYYTQWFHKTYATTLATDSNPIYVNPSISPPAPTANLPVSAGRAPFTPQHVLDVCLSGCTYKDPGTALLASSNNNWDYVKITIKGGDYSAVCSIKADTTIGCPDYHGTGNPPYLPFALSAGLPRHLWVYGWSPDGVTFPHFYGSTTYSGSLLATGNITGYATVRGQASLTVDNIEFGPWNYWLMTLRDATAVTLRNDYIHDCGQGIITSNAWPLDLYFYNVHIARCGGSNGPQHDVYIGEGDGTNNINVLNSVFEQPKIGHAFKMTGKVLNVSCSIFQVNTDLFYRGSEAIDVAAGGQWTMDHSLNDSGGGGGVLWTEYNSYDNIRFHHGNYGHSYNDIPISTNSLWLGDIGAGKYFFTWGAPLYNPPNRLWTGNTFVIDQPSDLGGYGLALNASSQYPALTGVQTDMDFTNAGPIYTSRAAAGLPAIGSYPQSYYDILPIYNSKLGSFCTDPIGNVLLPTSAN